MNLIFKEGLSKNISQKLFANQPYKFRISSVPVKNSDQMKIPLSNRPKIFPFNSAIESLKIVNKKKIDVDFLKKS